MQTLVDNAGLAGRVTISSAGTGDWHIGERADERALAALERRGYDASRHRARQFVAEWFDDCDLIVALDTSNLAELRRLAPAHQADKVRLLSSFDPESSAADVPDPYYGDAAAFDDVVTIVEHAGPGLLAHVQAELRG